MDLAILVYVISMLNKFSTFFIFMSVISIGILIVASIYRGAELGINDWDDPKRIKFKEDRVPGCERIMWVSGTCAIMFCILNIMTPTEKTAYTMVGAYAAQKVAENPQVQEMSGKVITIINQKLDTYVEEGLDAAKKRLESVDGKSKSKE